MTRVSWLSACCRTYSKIENGECPLAIQTLIHVLSELNNLHLTLIHLAEEKKQVIIHNDIDALNRIVARETKLLSQLTELDQARISAISEYMRSKGFVPTAAMTITALSKMVFKAEEKNALLEAQAELLATIDRFKELHLQNQQMIKQSLAYIDFSLDLIAGPPEDTATYHNPNKLGSSNGRSIFDTRA